MLFLFYKLNNELCNKSFHVLFSCVLAQVSIKSNDAPAKTDKEGHNPLNSSISYSDLKLAVISFIRNKWQKDEMGILMKTVIMISLTF